MFTIVVLALIIGGIIWWYRSQRAVSLNERMYLRQRGYDPPDEPKGDRGVAQETRLMDLLDSLDDVTAYSRERAAEEISLMCESGQRDERMYAPLVTALDDSNASVRGAAAIALGHLGDSRAIEQLNRVADGDDSPHARAQARRALERLKDVTSKDEVR